MESHNHLVQTNFQNGPLLISRLKYKAAKLQLALKDKENAFAKLQESTKATSMHELKLQTQVYYDEILRLLNQVSLLQDAQNLGEANPVLDEPSQKTESKNEFSKKDTLASSKREGKLFEAVMKLQDENKLLLQQLDHLHKQNNDLKEGIPTQIETESVHIIRKDAGIQCEMSPPSLPSSMIPEDCVLSLKEHIELLQKREQSWEEERVGYQGLFARLEKNRHFYQKISQEKSTEVTQLQDGLSKLNEEIQHLHQDLESLPDKIPQQACQSCSNKKYSENFSQTNVDKDMDSSHQSSTSLAPKKPAGAKTHKSSRKMHTRKNKESSNYLKKPLLSKSRPASIQTDSTQNDSSSDNDCSSSEVSQHDAVHYRIAKSRSKSISSNATQESFSPTKETESSSSKSDKQSDNRNPTASPSCSPSNGIEEHQLQDQNTSKDGPEMCSSSASDSTSTVNSVSKVLERQADTQLQLDVDNSQVVATSDQKVIPPDSKGSLAVQKLQAILEAHQVRGKMLEQRQTSSKEITCQASLSQV